MAIDSAPPHPYHTPSARPDEGYQGFQIIHAKIHAFVND